jgi:hypothetical protein
MVIVVGWVAVIYQDVVPNRNGYWTSRRPGGNRDRQSIRRGCCYCGSNAIELNRIRAGSCVEALTLHDDCDAHKWRVVGVRNCTRPAKVALPLSAWTFNETGADWIKGIPCTVAVALTANEDALGFWFAGAISVIIENWPAVICGGWKLADTPEGRPETFNEASCVNPFVLASDSCTVALCPGNRVTEDGPAASVKLEDDTTVSALDEVELSPSTVTVIGPLAAPDGITKERLPAVKLEIGAMIVPPPC